MIEKVQEILAEESEKMTGFIYTGNGYVQFDKQIKAIHAIKNKLRWKRKTLFIYILKCFEDDELKNRLTPKEIRYHNLSAVYTLLDTKQKSLIIKRMDLMKKKYAGSSSKY